MKMTGKPDEKRSELTEIQKHLQKLKQNGLLKRIGPAREGQCAHPGSPPQPPMRAKVY